MAVGGRRRRRILGVFLCHAPSLSLGERLENMDPLFERVNIARQSSVRQAAVVLGGLDADLSRTALRAGLDAGRTGGNQPVALLQLARKWILDSGGKPSAFASSSARRPGGAWTGSSWRTSESDGPSSECWQPYLAESGVCIQSVISLLPRRSGVVFVGIRGISGARSPPEIFRVCVLLDISSRSTTLHHSELSFTMRTNNLLTRWDCHVHVWDPEHYPY